MYWWFVYFMFSDSVLRVAVCKKILVLVEYEDFSLLSCFQGFKLWALSSLLTWEFSTPGLWVVLHKFPCTRLTTWSFMTFTDSTGHPEFCAGFSPRAPRAEQNHVVFGLAFAGIIGLGFAIGELSLEVASWLLFDMTLCFPFRIRKTK